LDKDTSLNVSESGTGPWGHPVNKEGVGGEYI